MKYPHVFFSFRLLCNTETRRNSEMRWNCNGLPLPWKALSSFAGNVDSFNSSFLNPFRSVWIKNSMHSTIQNVLCKTNVYLNLLHTKSTAFLFHVSDSRFYFQLYLITLKVFISSLFFLFFLLNQFFFSFPFCFIFCIFVSCECLCVLYLFWCCQRRRNGLNKLT